MTIRRALVILTIAALVMYVLGAWLMSIYGLDPPYAYFNIGLTLYLGSFGVALAVLLLLALLALRRGYRALFRPTPRA